MKKTTLLLVFAFVGMAAFSQTKRIAHRSHSGSDKTFRLFDYKDNFGDPAPEWKEEKKKMTLKDTLKLIRYHKKVKQDTVKVISPGKYEKKDTIKTIPVTKEMVVKEEVFAVLSAAKFIVTL